MQYAVASEIWLRATRAWADVIILADRGQVTLNPGQKTPATLDQMIGANIRRLRESRGHPTDALASKIGLPPELVMACERGERHFDAPVLYHICEVLECGVTELFEGLV